MRYEIEIDDDLLIFLEGDLAEGETVEAAISKWLSTLIKDKTHFKIYMVDKGERKKTKPSGDLLELCDRARGKVRGLCPCKGKGTIPVRALE